MDYTDPYGLNLPGSPIEARTITLNQGSTLILHRRFTTPAFAGGGPIKPDNCRMVFTVVTSRFNTDVVYSADWDKGIVLEPNGDIKIWVPSAETSTFRRGSFLYSITWHDTLMSMRELLEEGNLLVEYPADAPDPEIPYNSTFPVRQEQTSQG